MIQTSSFLDTVRVTSLRDKKFIIKDYQRGYRWDRQQAHDLLQDIWDFPVENGDEWYCLQPLVVKPINEESDSLKIKLQKLIDADNLSIEVIQEALKDNTTYEVIDGQQRLTTLFILERVLGYDAKFSIEYETRENSQGFLKDIQLQKDPETIDKYIDFYNMVEVRDEISDWFKDTNTDKEAFLKKLENVRFIWYETEEDAIEVFERLNIGKIALTNAELIKALFLNRYNFDQDSFSLSQQKMAINWDSIEKQLQDDEFWLFIHNNNWDKPTRIDYLFDIICNNDKLQLQKLLGIDNEKYEKKLGNDKYRTFRYFYEFVQQKKASEREDAVNDCWEYVYKLFHIFEEWFADMRLYHYIGFLIETSEENDIEGLIIDLIDLWEGYDAKSGQKSPSTKDQFKSSVATRIKDHFIKGKSYYTLKDLRYNNRNRRYTKDALLLYNLETVVRQNDSYKGEKKYQMEAFYRFPFHLYKKEVGDNNKGWDVEHIDSATTNPLTSVVEQKDWIKTAFIELDKANQVSLKEKVVQFLSDKDNKGEKVDFQTLYEEMMSKIPQSTNPLIEDEDLGKNEKYAIWNLALLDSGTNRSYKNAIFPAKRRSIIGRDKGELYEISINDDGTSAIETKNSAIAFIPPCTKNAFLKYYTPDSNNILTWGRDDAELYLKDMTEVLEPFIKAE